MDRAATEALRRLERALKAGTLSSTEILKRIERFERRALSQRGTRIELSTKGFDPDLQLVGANPWHSGGFVGMRIPPTPPKDKTQRYLYTLALGRYGARRRARLVGFRQLVTIGTYVVNGEGQAQTKYPLELEVESPSWHFTDANIMWSIVRTPPMGIQTSNPGNTEGFQFQYAQQSGTLLYETTFTDAKGYTPPNAGRAWGDALLGDLAAFNDLRSPWRSFASCCAIDCEFEGPCDIALYASVLQTNPQTRVTLTLPNLPAGNTNLPKEDSFVVNFPNSVYWRIAGSLIFEEEPFYPMDLAQGEVDGDPWCPPHETRDDPPPHSDKHEGGGTTTHEGSPGDGGKEQGK